jgi:hypothetical protein
LTIKNGAFDPIRKPDLAGRDPIGCKFTLIIHADALAPIRYHSTCAWVTYSDGSLRMRRWFLSYHSLDQALAERLKAALERKDVGAHVFFAPSSLRAGGFWSRALAEEIAQADVFILLVGERGVGNWQVLEYDEALDKRVKFSRFPRHPGAASRPDRAWSALPAPPALDHHLSEAEWEYAARAGSDRTYWDEMLEITKICQNTPSSCPEDYYAKAKQWIGPTQPVGSFASNKFGLYDMDVNVWEWMQDCFAYTSDGAPKGGSITVPQVNLAIPEAGGVPALLHFSASTSDNCNRVVRGGTWIGNPQFVLEIDRLSYPPVTRLDGLGARVGRTLAP